MLKEIRKWLNNPKRKYSEGLNYFNLFASQKQKDSFGQFLNGVDVDNIAQYDADGRFPLLINQVVFCERRIKSSPEMFIQSTAEDPKSDKSPVKRAPAINLKGTTGGTDKLPAFTAIGRITAPAAEIGTSSNVNISALNQLPPNFSPAVTRLKELVPYMAKVHADMAAEIADDKRKLLRIQLVELDDERRRIWERIDNYLQGNGQQESIDKSAEEKEVEENMLILGRDMARRIGQLRGYITRNQNSFNKFSKSGDKKKAASAKAKVEQYTKELNQLEAMFPENK
jgi:hypothetical protein